MTEANTTHVIYKALADFSDLRKRIKDARKELRDLQKDEQNYNKTSTAGAKESAAAHDKATTSLEKEADAFEDSASAAGKSARAIMAQAAEVRKADKNWNDLSSTVQKTNKFVRDSDAATRMAAKGFGAADSAGKRFNSTISDFIRRANNGRNSSQTLSRGVDQLHRSFIRLGNWRPRLIPPFIALIPVIASVVAAINPLISVLGAAGGAAIGFANALGSLSGVALALPGILSGIVAGVSSVIAAFGGMGNVFRAYGQIQRASLSARGSGSSGPSPEDRAMALEDAEERLSDSQRRAARAQINLNKARQQALKDLIALRIEVGRASLNEERALANLELAREAYYNVLAEPGSTAGDKMDALASLKEAEADLQDVRRQNVENAEALAEAEKKGVEGSDAVVDAQEELSDALREVRKAQKALRDETNGTNDALSGSGGLQTATNAYEDALNKLSPSARAFVLALIDMKTAWDEMRKGVQEAFFSELLDNLDEMRTLIPVIGNLWTKAAGAMGRFVSKGLEMLASGPWTRDFGTIADSNVVIIENLTDGFLTLLDAMRHLVVAAAPFTEWLTNGLKKGTENFRDMVQAGRESGDLASWLDKVRGRLEKWWLVVKNIGATIFNYGAAASEFGDWITDGMVRMTESWRAASEEARKEGSPFRVWLEDIKPVLSEVKGLFGDFFSWFAQESANPDNLKDAQDLLKLIRDDLGPAVGRFLDKLAETDIDEALVTALSSILDSITEIIDKGGNAAFVAFFDVVTAFFSAVADIVQALPPGALEPLLKLIGAIAGLAIVAKFPGVNLLFKGLTKLASNEKVVNTVLDNLKTLSKASWAGMERAFNAVVAAGKSKLPTPAPGAAGGGAGLVGGGAIVAGAAAGIGGLFSSLDKSISEMENFDLLSYLFGTKEQKKTSMDALADVAGNFVLSPGLTGLMAWLAPDQLEAVQNTASDILRNIWTWVEDLPNQISSLGVDIWEGLSTFGDWLIEQWNAAVQWFIDLPYNIGLTAGNIWNLIKSFLSWLGDQWEAAVQWFIDLPTNIAIAAGNIWDQIVSIGTWLVETVWPGFLTWLQRLPENIRVAAGNIWNRLINIPTWLTETVWPAFKTWLGNLPENIKTAAGNIWRSMGSIGDYLAGQWTKLTQWLGDLPGKIARKVGNLWDWLFGGVTKGWSDSQDGAVGDAPGGAALKGIRGPNVTAGGLAASRVSAALKAFPGLHITETLGNRAWDVANGVNRSPNSYHYDAQNPAVDIAGPTSMLNQLYRVLVGMGGWRQMLWQVPGHYDHIHVANTGGKVPGHGNGDTVPFRLTPGEFVLRKAVVNRLGADNVARLNSGVLSYTQLLERAYASQGVGKKKQTGAGFGFDGSGLMSGRGNFNPLSGLSNGAPAELGETNNNSSSAYDQRIIVENMNVHNPKAEPASDSLPRSIRKLAYATSGLRSGR